MEEKVSENSSVVVFSLKRLFLSLKEKWVLSISIAIITLLISCFGYQHISRNNDVYISRFQADWPGISINQYPNGRPFNYKKLVSLENLTYVKESNKDFNSIDIDSMYNENGISLKLIPEEKIPGKEEFGYNYYYNLVMNQKYFDNKNQAIKFARQIIETDTFDRAKEEISSYKILNYFDNQTEKTEYPEMLSNISRQVNLQRNTLNDLITKSSIDFLYDEENNLSLGELKNKFDSFLTYNDYSRFESEMRNKKLVRNIDTFRDEFTTRLDTINLEIEKNNRKIKALKDLGYDQIGQDNVPQMVADLTLRNEDLIWQKEYIEDCLSAPNTDALASSQFESKIIKYQEDVTEFNKALELAYKEVYEPKVLLEYDKNKILISQKTSIVKILIFGVIVTIFIEFILSLILTHYLNKKKQLA